MNYRCLNIRFDSKHSININTVELIAFIKSFPELKQTDKVQFKNIDDYPWGVISLLKCDENGCFSLDKDEYFEQVNLIELLFSDTKELLSYYLEIGTRIAEKMNWELMDDDVDEILVNKKRTDETKPYR